MNGDLGTQATILKNHLKDCETVVTSGIVSIRKAETKSPTQGIPPFLSILDGVREAERGRTEVELK